MIYLLAGLIFSLESVSCGLLRPAPAPSPERPPRDISRDDTIQKPPIPDPGKKPKDDKKARLTDSLDKIYPVVKKDKYVIAVYLPLYLEDTMRMAKRGGEISIATDFYRGLLLGADTLKKCGVNLDLHVFDSESERLTLNSTRSKLTQINADLVIGPLLEGRITWMDTLTKSLRINHVSSLLTSSRCDTSRKYYFETNPSSETIADSLAHFIEKRYAGYNRILVNEMETKGNDLAEAFTKALGKDSLNTIDFRGNSPSTYEPPMDLKDSNIIFVTSRSPVFVSALMTQLLKNEQEIIVAGTLPWTFFKSVDGDIWEKFRFHIPAQYYIDYANPALEPFIRSYRDTYKEEPTVYSFFGFDELVFFGQAMYRDGKYFQRAFVETPDTQPMLHTSYRYQWNAACGGWQNTYVNMLKFENYELLPISTIEQ